MQTDLIQLRRVQSVRAAFTFTELLLIIGMIGLLALMLMPAFAGNRTDSSAFRCLNNLRQMQVGWTAYSNDNGGKICPTINTGDLQTNQSWCYGRMDLPEGTSPEPIQRGLLWPYIKSLSAYKCPADTAKRNWGNTQQPTLRSISCNAWLNPRTPWDSNGRVFRKQSDIANGISPSTCGVFVDENDKTINDSSFIVSGPKTATRWVDCMASYHDKACGISFADAHAEMKRWRDRYILGPNPVLFMPADPANNYADLCWMQRRSTVFK